MNKDNIGQKALFFFIVIFFVIGAAFAFLNRKKIVDFFKSKDILKMIKNYSSQNVLRKKNNPANSKPNKPKRAPSPLNNRNKNNDQSKNKGSNDNDKDRFLKKNMNINDEKDDEDDEEEYQKKYQHNYSSKRDLDNNQPFYPQSRDEVSSNSRRTEFNSSSGDSWIITLFKNVISLLKNVISSAVWFLGLFVDILKIVFGFFSHIFIGPLLGFLLFVFVSMTAAKYISFCDWIPKKCYDFCSSKIGEIDFFRNHDNVKKYTDKFLKFILRVNSPDNTVPPAQQDNGNHESFFSFDIPTILSNFRNN